MDIQRCFEILELKSGVSIAEAKHAYKDIVNVWHPDRFADNSRLREKAEEKLKRINVAHDQVIAFLSSNRNRWPANEESSLTSKEIKPEFKEKTRPAKEIIESIWSYFSRTVRYITDSGLTRTKAGAGLKPGALNQNFAKILTGIKEAV